jgi:hypothetical protein
MVERRRRVIREVLGQRTWSRLVQALGGEATPPALNTEWWGPPSRYCSAETEQPIVQLIC